MIVGSKEFEKYVKAHEKELETIDNKEVQSKEDLRYLKFVEKRETTESNILRLELANSILGQDYLTPKNLAEVEENLLSVKNPGSLEFLTAQINLANILAMNKKDEAAITVLNVLIDNINNYEKWHKDLSIGNYFIMQCCKCNALTELDKIYTTNQDYKNVAKIRLEIAKSVDFSDPDSYQYGLKLARGMALKNNNKEAISYLELMLNGIKDNNAQSDIMRSRVLYSLSQVYIAEHDLDSAVNCLEQAREFTPNTVIFKEIEIENSRLKILHEVPLNLMIQQYSELRDNSIRK